MVFYRDKENCMARLKILLVTMSVLTLFIMCGGCESEGHDRRDDRWQDRQSEREQLERESEQERSDRYMDKDSESHEERHEERQ
jgi:hypothetical protein